MVDFYGINVGKYTVRPMDPMGSLKRRTGSLQDQRREDICVKFEGGIFFASHFPSTSQLCFVCSCGFKDPWMEGAGSGIFPEKFPRGLIRGKTKNPQKLGLWSYSW